MLYIATRHRRGGGGLLRQYNGDGGGVKEVSLPDPLKRPNLRHIAHAYLCDLEYSNNNKFRASFSPFSAFILYTLRFQINEGKIKGGGGASRILKN